MKKSIAYLLIVLHLFFAVAPMNAFAMSAAPGSDSTIVFDIKRAPDIKWQYTVINNVLYRRLYNYSTKTPITDWEVVP